MASDGFLRDIDGEKVQSIRSRAWELFGFGAQYAWMLSVLLCPTIFDYAVDDVWLATTNLILFAGLSLSYLVFFLLRNRLGSSRLHRGTIIVAGFCGMAATLLVGFPSSFGGKIGVSILAAVLAGFANSVAMLGGNRLWADHRPERAMMHIAPSTFVAVLLSLAIAFIPPVARVFVISLLPPLGNIILANSHAGKPRAGSYRRTPLDSRLTRRMSIYLACLAAVTACVLGFVAGNGVVGHQMYSWRVLLGVLIVAAASFALALRCSVTTYLGALSRLSFPIVLIGLALFFALGQGWLWVSVAFVLAGYVLMDLYMWLLNADLVYRSQQTSFAVLARSCALQWAGLVVGFAIGCGNGSLPFLPFEIDRVPLITGCIIVLAVAYTFIFSHHDAVLLAEARSENDLGMAAREDVLARMAEAHALSRRETEIFMLLANGRSAPYIQNQLTVSESTVNTHIRNVYRKFGVDSRQGLIDAIEEAIAR